MNDVQNRTQESAASVSFLHQVAKFAIVGVVNTGIDFLVLNLLMAVTDINSGPFMILLNSISFGVAVVNSYFLNKIWTFRDTDDGESDVTKFSQFVVVSIIGVAINSAVVFAITTYATIPIITNPVLKANIAKLFATGLSMIWNFIGYKFLVFKK